MILLPGISIASWSISTMSVAAPINIARLKNGKYSICINKKQSNYKDEQQRCFSFIKQGDRIKGAYEFSFDAIPICIVGSLKNNTVTGYAYDRSINSDFNTKYSGMVLVDEFGKKYPQLTTSKPIALPIAFDNYLQVFTRGKFDSIKVTNIGSSHYSYTFKVTHPKVKLDVGKFNYIRADPAGVSPGKTNECGKTKI